MGEQNTTEENNRARVRRLLLTPLADDGFRKNAKMSDDVFKPAMDRLMDALAYMSDHGLVTLYQMMRSKGQGRDRDIWPKRAQFYAIAELIEPCPLERIPGMVSWFASEAGAQAIENDTMLETFEFIETFKKPPVEDHNRKKIMAQAAKRRDDMQSARLRIERGRALEGDAAMIAYFEGRLSRVARFVEQTRQKKAEQVAA